MRSRFEARYIHARVRNARMRIQCLQHVNFEGPASIETWARERGLSMEKTDLSAGAALPGCDDFDWLVVMGGPMNVYEESAYPWLAGEKRLIGDAIGRGRLVLGVCLGAQLIASVLGAAVYRNSHREIGWFPVNRGEDAGDSGRVQRAAGRLCALSLAWRHL